MPARRAVNATARRPRAINAWDHREKVPIHPACMDSRLVWINRLIYACLPYQFRELLFDLNGTESLVLLYLWTRKTDPTVSYDQSAQRWTDLIAISYQQIAKAIRRSEPAVLKAVSNVEKLGYLKVTKPGLRR